MSSVNKESSTYQYLSWGHKQFLSRASSGPLKWTFTGLLLCIFLLSVYASFFTMELSVESRGVFFGATGSRSLFVENGIVDKITVVSGQYFKKGDILVHYTLHGQEEVLEAPYSGRVIKGLNYSGVVEDELWLEVEPTDQDYLVVVYVSQMDLPKIVQGAKAYIELSAISKARYGYFLGHVVSFDLKPTSDVRGPSATAVHKVVLKVDDASLKKLEYNKRISGMDAKAKIVWKKDKIMNFVTAFFMGVR